MIKSICKKKYSIAIISILIVTCLSSCQGSDQYDEDKVIRIIRNNSYVGDEGLIYDDVKAAPYKCYFDFNSMENIYLCSKPNCNHTALDCTSRICHPYTFIIGKDLYCIVKKYEMKDSKETFASYLYKSDISNTDARVVAKLEADILYNIYLVNNTLHIVAAKPKFVDGISTSAERWDLYQVNMKNYKVKKTTLNSKEGIDGYIPSGIIGNNMIIYHRYYDEIIDPEDYGLEGDPIDYMKDETSNRKYMAAVMEAFHEEMFSMDLDTGEQTQLDLTTPLQNYPLLVYRESYYYNRERADGSHEMVSYNFDTQEEKVIFNSPVKTCTAIGDNLFFTEGIEKISDTTFEPIIGYKENAKEFCYNLLTGELREVSSRLPEGAKMELVKEVDDKYIILYSDYNRNIEQGVGYILKEDYFKDKSKYTLVAPE